MVIYLLPVTRKKTKNNVRFETEAWNDSEIAHCSDTFYLRASCSGSSLCLVIERSWEWGCLLTRRFRRRHSCDMCCSHISDVTYWQWHLNHIWHYTFKHTPHKLKKERYIFKNHHHHNIMSGYYNKTKFILQLCTSFSLSLRLHSRSNGWIFYRLKIHAFRYSVNTELPEADEYLDAYRSKFRENREKIFHGPPVNEVSCQIFFAGRKFVPRHVNVAS